MRKFSAVVVLAFLWAMVPALVWGFFPASFTGLPALGGVFGGGACGAERSLPLAPSFYVGWAESARRGAHFGLEWIDPNIDPVVGGSTFLKRGQGYQIRGLWLGAAKTLYLTDSLGFMASGWYLFPASSSSTDLIKQVNGNSLLLTRDTRTQWWHVDGLFAVGPQSWTTLLAGLRYDSFTTRLGDTQQGEFNSHAWIPLVGLQFSTFRGANDLLMRLVGFPAVAGDLKYTESGPGAARDISGNYRSGSYFIEVFSEYSWRFGSGNLGIFGRWNLIHGNAELGEDLFGVNFRSAFAFNRHAFTAGGKLSLDFNLPF